MERSETFDERLKAAQQRMLAGEYIAAEAQLLGLDPRREIDAASRDHQLAVLKLRTGLVADAIEILVSIIHRNLATTAVWFDLTACYYTSGQIFSFQQALQQTEIIFSENRELLTKSQVADYTLLLGKFIEEQGQITKAMSLYKETQNLCQAEADAFFRVQYSRSLAQVLRVHAQYDIDGNVSRLYQMLVTLTVDQSDWDCVFEIEHALMLFELRHCGFEQAWFRFQNLLKNPLCQSFEAGLIYSDFLYELLLQKQPIPPELIQGFRHLTHLRTYEKDILESAQGTRSSLMTINEWQRKMAPAAYLRRLILCSRQFPEDRHLEQRVLLLLQQFSPADKKVWLGLISSRLAQQEIAFVYDADKLTLSGNGRELAFKAHSAHKELLELLIHSPGINCIDATTQLWQGEGSESDLSRLRMRVNRFNQVVARTWPVQQFIRILGSELNFSQKVDLRVS